MNYDNRCIWLLNQNRLFLFLFLKDRNILKCWDNFFEAKNCLFEEECSMVLGQCGCSLVNEWIRVILVFDGKIFLLFSLGNLWTCYALLQSIENYLIIKKPCRSAYDDRKIRSFAQPHTSPLGPCCLFNSVCLSILQRILYTFLLAW